MSDTVWLVAGIGGVLIYLFGNSKGWSLKEIAYVAALWGFLVGLH